MEVDLAWVRPLLLDGEYFGIPGASESIYVRFWSKVDQSAGLDACWPWLGALSTKDRHRQPRGYLQVGGRGTAIVCAPRLALALTTDGSLPNLHACHQSQACSVVNCCNPRHLRWDTQVANEADKIADHGPSRRSVWTPPADWAYEIDHVYSTGDQL